MKETVQLEKKEPERILTIKEVTSLFSKAFK